MMNRKQDNRWKCKATVVAAVAASLAGFAALSTNTASAGDAAAYGCPGVSSDDDDCPDTITDDTIPDTVPDDTIPDTVPDDTEPSVEQAPPAPAPSALVPGTPAVAAAASCANGSGTIELTLTNSAGGLAVTFTVVHPTSGASSTVTVAPSSTRQMTLLGVGTGTVDVSITAGGADLSRTVDVPCVAVEGPIQPAAPQIVGSAPSLPATGPSSALPTICIGIGLIGAGGVALALARRSSAARSNGS